MFLGIKLVNFRNIEDGFIDTGSSSVVFMGENGQGKTNLLESIYMLCYGISFRTKKNSVVVKNGFSNMSISSEYKTDNFIIPVSLKISGKKKKVFFNNKKAENRDILFDNFPCIVFANNDVDFIKGEPSLQRKFIDQILVINEPGFLYKLKEYRKLLDYRNRLLKDKKKDLLDVYDKKISQTGVIISQKRNWLVDKIKDDFSLITKELLGKSINLKFLSSYDEFDDEKVFFNLLKNRDKDITLGYTTIGAHRDRIYFDDNGVDFVSYASTGQIRTLALVLRILQARFISFNNKKKPILLLDDVLLELDPVRRKKVLSLLPEFSQIFFTFLPDEPSFNYINKDDCIIYNVANGRVKRI